MSFFQQHLMAEIDRRLQVMPAELDRWSVLAQANADGMGIHRSQLDALEDMFDGLQARQNGLAQELKDAPDFDTFVAAKARLERELCGAHGLLAIFRLMLAQREDAEYSPALDAADLISADCYRLFTDKARQWGALDEAHFREPPLTYLNALYSPAAFTRRHAFAAFKTPLEGYSELKLPISVLSLPFSHTAALWTFCSLYHEVGHPVDQDLRLAEALAPVLSARLEEAGASEGERVLWRRWLREMVADAVGVLLGGAAFVHAMTHVLLLPPGEVLALPPEDPHPNPFVRIFLLGALLRRSGWPNANAADQIEAEWRERYPAAQGQDGLAALAARADAAAATILESPLEALRGHALRDFASPAADDFHAGRLARFLREGIQRPDPKNPLFPVRLVPAAAQAALQGGESDFQQAGQRIHEGALRYASEIPRPQFLAGGDQKRREFLRQLTRDLDFSAMEDIPL